MEGNREGDEASGVAIRAIDNEGVIMRWLVGAVLILLPFYVLCQLLRRAKRNEAGQHGGGLREYWRIIGRVFR